MRVPAHIRFTLAELIAFGLQSADVLARANSAIHLVLTEQQEGLPSSGAQDECSIISVEDADGITVAVTKHRTGETWDRRVKTPIVVKSVEEGLAHAQRLFREADAGGLRGMAGGTIRGDGREPVAEVKTEQMARSGPVTAVSFGPEGLVLTEALAGSEPVVPRREPPHAAPAGEDRFQRGVDAMHTYLGQKYPHGGVSWFNYKIGSGTLRLDEVDVSGTISLRGLAKVFLDAYQPQITISDQVRFKQAKRAMRLLLRKWRDEGNIEHLAGSPAAPPEEWADHIGDIISIEGTIDIDALAKAFWSVMKGEG